jgi:hypothetical protein
MEERIELTARLLASGMPKGQVKRRLKAEWGVSARTCETYISRAREALTKQSGQAREELHLQAAAFYKSVIETPGIELRGKMLAQWRLVKLFGLLPRGEGRVRAAPPARPLPLGPPTLAELQPYLDFVQAVEQGGPPGPAEGNGADAGPA